jgi:hypothetical protein
MSLEVYRHFGVSYSAKGECFCACVRISLAVKPIYYLFKLWIRFPSMYGSHRGNGDAGESPPVA